MLKHFKALNYSVFPECWKIFKKEGIIKRFGIFIALDHIDLAINEGEIVGLLGPNGAGKTTLIQTLTGMVPHERGTVSLFENSEKPFSNENKEKIGVVTQEITLFEELTARGNLQFFAGVYGLKGEEKKSGRGFGVRRLE